jgi:ADP-ribosyl-[dinitrogen reductase] hydrolase
MVAALGGHERAVKAAIALGDDTDTTACVAGGIVGVRGGARAIPERWLAALRGRDVLDPLIEQLLTHQRR